MFVAGLVLLSATRADAASLTLQWDPSTDGMTTGYVIWFGNSAGSYTSWTDVGLVSTYKIEGLADNAKYCFAVQAYSAGGETSEFSTPVCATTPNAPSDGGTVPPAETPPPSDEPPSDPGSGSEIVLYAAATATNIRGHWSKTATAGAAGGSSMRSATNGWSAPNAPLAAPTHAFDLRFDAMANTPYRVWLRMRAASNSKWNDSVWVQFSDGLVDGRAAFHIGTTSALLANLEPCEACGVAGWGWANSAYWLRQNTSITFSDSGTKTIRIQTREDGVEIDQVVLSASAFYEVKPGTRKNDTTILPATNAPTSSPSPTPSPSGTPYDRKPKALPGTIHAAYFDQGGSGVAYVDSTPGNSGGVFRQTDVDLLAAASGGYFVSWTTPGEWVSYTVNVTTPGKYILKVKAASVGGGSVNVAFGIPSNVSKTITVPNTGAAQTIKTVSVPITLSAGEQVVTVKFLAGKINLHRIVLSWP